MLHHLKWMMFTLLASAAALHAQGPLTPPGAPAPVMKSLDQLEPRTPITNLPFTITQSGSYYLTGNMDVTGDGLIIRADHVTVDLTGFRIAGNGTGRGILLDKPTLATIRNVVIRNGHIVNFQTGIRAQHTRGASLENLQVNGHALHGVEFFFGDGNVLKNSSISDNAQHGVYLYGFLGACNHQRIEDCVIRGNGGDGVNGYGEFGQLRGNRIVDSLVFGNAGMGIRLNAPSGVCAHNEVVASTVAENGATGISLNGTAGQCDGNRIHEVALFKNSDHHIHLNGTAGNASGNSVTDSALSSERWFVSAAHAIFLQGGGHGTIIARNALGRTGSHALYIAPGDDVSTGHAIRHNAIVRGEGVGGRGGLVVYARGGQANGFEIAGNAMSNFEESLIIRAQAEGRTGGHRIDGNVLTGIGNAALFLGDGGDVTGSSFRENVIRGSTGNGIALRAAGGGRVAGHTLARNAVSATSFGYGITLGEYGESGGFVRGNQILDNTVAGASTGIRLVKESTLDNQVKGNLAASNQVANIRVKDFAERNVVVHNMVYPGGDSFDVSTDNLYGPLATPSGELGGGAQGHPWANFAPVVD